MLRTAALSLRVGLSWALRQAVDLLACEGLGSWEMPRVMAVTFVS
jgi:hypothetical protein